MSCREYQWGDTLHRSAAKGGPHKGQVAIDQRSPVYRSSQRVGRPQLATFVRRYRCSWGKRKAFAIMWICLCQAVSP